MTLYGTAGAASLHNVAGSFYDFRGEHWRGTSSEVIAQPPDDWGARALIQWTAQLAQTPSFDPAAEEYAFVAGVLDTIYRPAA
jgi:hypothetical protein